MPARGMGVYGISVVSALFYGKSKPTLKKQSLLITNYIAAQYLKEALLELNEESSEKRFSSENLKTFQI